MSAYNLYLLDESRDPRVIARLSRVTNLPEGVVRRELRHPPFLVLREHGLSYAVAVRRDFEQMGLTLRLERVEEPTGDRSHPLAGEQAPDDGREIVLEEGAGFTESAPVEAAPGAEGSGARRSRTRAWRWLASLAALVLALGLLAGWSWWRRESPAPDNQDTVMRLDRELPVLQVRLERSLRADLSAGPGADSLIAMVDELERLTRQVWGRLSRRQRRQVEDLLARRETLVLRRQAASAPVLASNWSPRDLQPLRADVDGEEFWRRLAVQWGRRTAPASLGEQLVLERLDDELARLAVSGDAASRAKVRQLERLDPEGRRRLGALRLAGSLRQKGLAWSGEGAARQGWIDLPDSAALDLQEDSGALHLAHVVEGRLVLDSPTGELQSVTVRLAALERQPEGLRRVLESGLRLFAPEVYFATLPGSRLPRLNPALAEAQWVQTGDPALKEELKRLGLKNGDLRRPVLEQTSVQAGARPDLADWLQAAAAHYRQARAWPATLELRTPAGRFHVSGCELWHLTRPLPD